MTATPGSFPFRVRDLLETDRSWSRRVLQASWGSTFVVSRGRLHRADALPGLVALARATRVGLLTYRVEGSSWEIVTLDALLRRQGVGTALLRAAMDRAASASCRRLWLVTTNDNLPAQRLYERSGFRKVAVHVGAVEVARRLKPEIPRLGHAGLPVRDELEYELDVPATDPTFAR